MPAAVINAGILLAGKVPVNLNFTTGEATFRISMRQCSIQTVITSRAFTERVPLPAEPDRTVFAEDIPGLVGKWRGLKAVLKAWLAPQFALRLLYGIRDRSVDDLATVIFSSGTTGEPKGIMLTHSNIMSNIDGLGQVFGLTEEDCICGVLPFFHSFGFTATLWFPLVKR
ncbi:MAG: AMP-binding protein, partial [Planctomycetota bacterium]